jgi:hypothetical protein
LSNQWLVVARAIDDRMSELGITQRILIRRSGLSKAVVREIQHHIVERRRSPRTLEALSVALEWHPDHLAALSRNEPLPDREDPLTHRLDAIERRLDELHDKIDKLITLTRSDQPGQ